MNGPSLPDRFRWRPSACKTPADSRCADACSPRPFRERQRKTVGRHGVNTARVIRLRLRSRPSHIGRLVVAVVVDAINRMLPTWPWSNIGVERLERVAPSVADGDTSSSVVGIALKSWIPASVLHANPDSILWRLGSSVRRGSVDTGLQSKTAARQLLSGPESVGRGGDDRATVTAAFPRQFPLDSTVLAQHTKSAKSRSWLKTDRPSFRVILAPKTPTRSRGAAFEMSVEHSPFFAAVATANGATFIAWRRSGAIGDNDQTSESLAYKGG